MWQYVQKTGEMFDRSGALLERGYSGRGAYKNDPAAQCRRNEGPIPRGEYAIGAAIATHGPVTLPLEPAASNDMCRPPRSAFLIHGDSIAEPGNASQGCVILGRNTRERIRDSDDKTLLVVGDRSDLEFRPTSDALYRNLGASTAPVVVAFATGEYALAPEAEALILDSEGVDQPGDWPGLSSGITIGYGYDLGYCTVDAFEHAWATQLEPETVMRLRVAIGLRGREARDMAPSFRDIRITKAAARAVFDEVMVDEAWMQTRKAFPGVETLPPLAQGALLSLVLNRGTSMHDDPGEDRRREMREIRRLVGIEGMAADEKLRRIATQLRSMKRLWQGSGMDGLLRRRDVEAGLVERAAEPAPPSSAPSTTAARKGRRKAGKRK